MSTDPPQRSPRGKQGFWIAMTASQLGAAHIAAGLPNQDAVATHQIRPDVLVAAVADGHGHHRHFRSARGSELAVGVACEAARELVARLDGFKAAKQIEYEVLHTLVPAITGRWRDAVRADIAAEPFTSEEEALRAEGDNALIAYGSTLLLAIAGRKWLVLAQIGDGDIVGIQISGRPLLPVPSDPSLNGQQTTSLCGARAEEDFRAAVVDVATTTLLGILLATDGYGNAQVDDPWADGVSADLAELIGDRPPEWLADQLPLWAGRCASADGSADDTTIALLIAPSVARRRRHQVASATDELAAGAARRLTQPTVRAVGGTAATREQRLAKSAMTARAGSAPAAARGGSAPAAARAGSAPAAARGGSAPAAARGGSAPAAAGGGSLPAAAGGRDEPPRSSARWPRRRVAITAVLVLIAVVAAFAVSRLVSSSGAAPAASPSPAQAHGGTPHGQSGTAPAKSGTVHTACHPPSSGIGTPVTGSTTTVCDPITGRTETIPLPAGTRVALQAGGLIFVLVGDKLGWSPINAQGPAWTDLGAVPSGPQQEMCFSPPSVVVAVPSAASAGGASTSWIEVSVPAESPGHVALPSLVTRNPCPVAVSR